MRTAEQCRTEGPREYCTECRRPRIVCLCAEIPPFAGRTKFVFLMHPKEAKKIKNGTGRLAHLSLVSSELHVGIDFTQNARVNELLADPAFDCRLLYPAPAETAPEPAAPGATPVLFVIDATWQCAKKIVRLSTNLHGLPRMVIDVDEPSEFVIKHQPNRFCLGTIEAVDRILEELAEGGEETYGPDDSERLLRPFHRMNQIALEYAAAPLPKSYRGGKPFKRPEDRRMRAPTRSGRAIVFQG